MAVQPCMKRIPIKKKKENEQYLRKNQKFCPDSLSEAPEIDAKVIDLTTIINMFKPTYGKTFCDYRVAKTSNKTQEKTCILNK